MKWGKTDSKTIYNKSPKYSKHPYTSWTFLIKSDLTFKWHDKIWDVAARREDTSQSCFWKLIWGIKVHDKPEARRKIFSFKCWARDAMLLGLQKDAACMLPLQLLGQSLGPHQGPLSWSFGESCLEILILNSIINTLRSPPLILDSKQHTKTRKIC